MSHIPPHSRQRVRRVVNVSSALTAFMSVALLAGTLAPATAQPVRSAPVRGASVTQKPQAITQARAASAVAKVKIGNSSFPLAGTNLARRTNKVVLYKAPRKATPKSKRGVDVLVVHGKVAGVKVLKPGKRNVKVPAGGYVVSGKGSAARWLRWAAKVGAVVGTAVNSQHSSAVSVPTTPVGTSAPMALPAKVVSVYHMMWAASRSPQLRDIPAQTNVVNLAFLQGDAPTLVGWGSQSEASFLADAKMLRARGVRIVASIGGSGGDVNVANREAFVQAVMNLNAKLTLDGIDWDIEGGTAMATSDVVWISRRLKQLRGNAFAVTLAPNGSNIDQYKAIAVELNKQGALDMIAQQFYDAPVSEGAMMGRLDQLAAAGIPQSKFGVGMMVQSGANWWTVDVCISRYKAAKAKYPGIRGGYLWQHGIPAAADWANRLGPILKR